MVETSRKYEQKCCYAWLQFIYLIVGAFGDISFTLYTIYTPNEKPWLKKAIYLSSSLYLLIVEPIPSVHSQYNLNDRDLRRHFRQQFCFTTLWLLFIEITEETRTRSLSYCQTITQRRETNQSSHLSVKEYQSSLCETQRLHTNACHETTTLKRELDELKTQLQIQQRRLEYEARKTVLEEHKTALMLLRGRRTADGCSESEIGKASSVNKGEMQSRAHDSPEVVAFREYSPEVSPPEVSSREATNLSGYINTESENSALNLNNVKMRVTPETELTSETEINSTPEVPVMISVATSTNDLHLLEADVELDEEEPRGEWNIRENILYREEAEGRSRSVSPYTAEKKSYAKVEASESEVVYQLDEEVRRILI